MKQVLLLLLLVPLVTSVTYSYAEEFTVDVPFDYQSSGCHEVENTENKMIYSCTMEWVGENHLEDGEETTPAEDGCRSGFDIDIRTGECKPHEQIEEEALKECEVDPTCPAGWYEPPTEQEKLIEEMEDEIHLKPSDKRLLHYLEEEVAKCLQGIGTTQGIQNKRNFAIPLIEVPVYGTGIDGARTQVGISYQLDTTTVLTSIDFSGKLKTIKLAVAECQAQEKLLNTQGGILSTHDAQIGMCDRKVFATPQESVENGCGFVLKYHANIAKKVPVMTQSMANEKANFGLTTKVLRDKHAPECSHNISPIIRSAYGCPDLEPLPSGNGKIPQMKDYNANGPGEKFENYKNDDGKRQQDILAKEAINKKIQKLKESLKKYN